MDFISQKPVIRLFHTLSFYVCLILIGVIFLVGALLCGGTAWFFTKPKAVQHSRQITSTAFNIYLNICQSLGLMKLDLKALDDLNEKTKQGALIIAANHPSLIDVVLLTARLHSCTCIAKDSLIQHPVLGISARANDYISNASLSAMLKKAIRLIESGSHILIFPEGTRTKVDGRSVINPLGGSASIISKRTKSKIQLVYIQTNSEFLGPQWPILKCPQFPIVYTVKLGELIEPNQSLDESILQMQHAFEKNLTPISAK